MLPYLGNFLRNSYFSYLSNYYCKHNFMQLHSQILDKLLSLKCDFPCHPYLTFFDLGFRIEAIIRTSSSRSSNAEIKVMPKQRDIDPPITSSSHVFTNSETTNLRKKSIKFFCQNMDFIRSHFFPNPYFRQKFFKI